MRVVGYVLDAEAEGGGSPVEGEPPFDACARFLAEAVVPPMSLAVEMAEVESGRDVLEGSRGSQVDGVFPEPEVEVCRAMDAEVADPLSDEPELGGSIIVERASLSLADFSSDGNVVFRVAVEDVDAVVGLCGG